MKDVGVGRKRNLEIASLTVQARGKGTEATNWKGMKVTHGPDSLSRQENKNLQVLRKRRQTLMTSEYK